MLRGGRGGAAPAEADAAPAAAPADAEGWLHRLETLASGRAGFDARLRYTTVQGLLDDEQVRFGRLRLAHGVAGGAGSGDAGDDPAAAADRFRIDLTGEVVDAALRPLDRRLVWDGRRLLDADADRREASVRAFDDPSELTATLPIPMRVDADELLARYEVTLVPGVEEAGDEEAGDGIHLRLADRADPDADPLEVWFDAQSGLPLRGRSGRPGGDTRTVDLVEAAAVDGFEPGLFDTAPPAGPGWRVQEPAGAE